MSQQAGQDIPLQINPGEWEVVLRNGQPTLVPKRTNAPLLPTANAQTTAMVNDPTVQIANRVSDRVRGQALTLHHAAQNTSLNDDQYKFLKDELAKLRHELAIYDRNIEARRTTDRPVEPPLQARPPSRAPIYQHPQQPVSQNAVKATPKVTTNGSMAYSYHSTHPTPAHAASATQATHAPNGNGQIQQPPHLTYAHSNRSYQVPPQAGPSRPSNLSGASVPQGVSPNPTSNATYGVNQQGHGNVTMGHPQTLTPQGVALYQTIAHYQSLAAQSGASNQSRAHQQTQQAPSSMLYPSQSSAQQMTNRTLLPQYVNQPPTQVQNAIPSSRLQSSSLQQHSFAQSNWVPPHSQPLHDISILTAQHSSRPNDSHGQHPTPLSTQNHVQGLPTFASTSAAPLQSQPPIFNRIPPLATQPIGSIQPAPEGLAKSVLQMLRKRKGVDSPGTSPSKRSTPPRDDSMPSPTSNQVSSKPPVAAKAVASQLENDISPTRPSLVSREPTPAVSGVEIGTSPRTPALVTPEPTRARDFWESDSVTAPDSITAPEEPVSIKDELKDELVEEAGEALWIEPLIIDTSPIVAEESARIEEVVDVTAPNSLQSSPLPRLSATEENHRLDTTVASQDQTPEPLFLPISSPVREEYDKEPTIRPVHRFLYVLVPDHPELMRSFHAPDVEIKETLGHDDAKRLVARVCHWTGCDSRFDCLRNLASHVQRQHVDQKQKMPGAYTCRWKECRKVVFPTKRQLSRHLFRHMTMQKYCMHADCDFTTRSADELRSHITDQHNGDMSQLKPIVDDLYYGLPEPLSTLPDTVSSLEAVKLPVYGHPNARPASRTPSPKPVSSQALALMPLSPTKRAIRPAYSQESPVSERRSSDTHDHDHLMVESSSTGSILDQYAFLEPFYKISFKLDTLESDEDVVRVFNHEIRRSAPKKTLKEKGKRTANKKKQTKGVRFASPAVPLTSGNMNKPGPSGGSSSPGMKQKRKKGAQNWRGGGGASGARSESEPTDDDELLLRA